jgi:hypothetical protein
MIVADNLARGLGAVGTLVALAALWFQWRADSRDRPRLALSLALSGNEAGLALEVSIVNKGYRSVTLTEVYVGWGPPAAPPPPLPIRIERRARFLLLGQWRHRWPKRLQRLLAESEAELDQDGFPITGVGVPGFEPVLLATGDLRTYGFPRSQLGLLGANPPPVYIVAIDAHGRATRKVLLDEFRQVLLTTDVT